MVHIVMPIFVCLGPAQRATATALWSGAATRRWFWRARKWAAASRSSRCSAQVIDVHVRHLSLLAASAVRCDKMSATIKCSVSAGQAAEHLAEVQTGHDSEVSSASQQDAASLGLANFLEPCNCSIEVFCSAQFSPSAMQQPACSGWCMRQGGTSWHRISEQYFIRCAH